MIKLLITSFIAVTMSVAFAEEQTPLMRFSSEGDENSFPYHLEKGDTSSDINLDFCFYGDQSMNVFLELGGRDPLEGFNRVMFSTTDFFVRWIFRPVGTVYSTIMPRPGIRAINNITNNVAFPKRFLSCILQGKFKDSGLCFTRFVVNSTAGVGGAWDASDYFLDIKERDEDFGQAFASWGIGPGCYVFVPGEGPCNLRNAVGKVFDYAVDIKSYFYGGQAATGFHKLLARYEDYDMLVKSSADPYHLMKNFWYVQRMNQIKDSNLQEKFANLDLSKVKNKELRQRLEYIKMSSYGSQGVEVDTLKAMFFDVQKEKQSFWTYLSLFNSDFVSQMELKSIKLYEDKDAMDYCFWMQDDNPRAPLILIIPGLGSHHHSSKVMALAEVLHNRGFAVAAISSTFNWHFMETAASCDAPGFLPADAKDTRKVFSKIIPQLEKEDNINPRRIMVVGYSMGAIQALHIAKLEEEQNTLGVDRYLAINPPVDLIYGMSKLDEYYNDHKNWGKEEFVRRATLALGKMMAISEKHYSPHDSIRTDYQSHHKLSIDKDDARFLVGYSFKMTLQEMLISMYRRGKFTHLKTKYEWSNKGDIYNEILKVDFDDYLKYVLKHYYKDRFGKDISDEEFIKKIADASHIKSFKNHFIDNPDIRIVHTMDDFLVRDKGRKWMKDIFKDRIVFFEHGGHLGNLHFRKVQDKCFEFLKASSASLPEQEQYYEQNYVSLAAPYSVPSIPPATSDFHNPR